VDYGAAVLKKRLMTDRMAGERIPTEHEEQRELVKWFRQSFDGVRIFAIPNGGARTITTAAKLKVEGVSAGVPDLYVPEWKLWIEMKRVKGGVVDKAQKDWHDYLTAIGDRVIVCRGADEAKRMIETVIDFNIEMEGK
jgi:hypothetical protein